MDKWCELLVWNADIKQFLSTITDNDETIIAKHIDGRISLLSAFIIVDLYCLREESLSKIVALAKLPTGEIGEEFGFETALLLMKEGLICQSLVKCGQYNNDIYLLNNENQFMIYCESEEDWFEMDLDVKVILGKWRLA